jgi:hypothetical protein
MCGELGVVGLRPLLDANAPPRGDTVITVQAHLWPCGKLQRTHDYPSHWRILAPQYRRGQHYIEELTDPHGLKVLIEWPCKHPSCFWAKANTPMITRATRTSPATMFFIMATTPGVPHYADRGPRMMNTAAAAVNAL